MAKAAKISKPKPRPVGRPSGYDPAFNELARKYCLLGATDADLASFFEVDERTINLWKTAHPEFIQSIKEGKEQADANVASRLYSRAMGYSHPEDKIFNEDGVPLIVPTTKHYPPDAVSCIFWLKNRQRAKWRDAQEVDHKGKVEVEVNDARETIISRITGVASRTRVESPPLPGKPH